MRISLSILLFTVLFILACNSIPPQQYDTIIRNGMIYDGKGGKPYRADLAILNDTIAAIGDLKNATAQREIDAQGLAVAPGFINMLSWADKDLLKDGRSM